MWDASVKEGLTNGLEFSGMPAVGKKDAADICTTYHHHSSKQGRYRTKALTKLAPNSATMTATESTSTILTISTRTTTKIVTLQPLV